VDRAHLSETHVFAFVEAALSPAKYAIFHYFGYLFIATTGLTHPPESSAVKIGAFGGSILTLVYFSLLWRKSNTTLHESTGSTVIYAADLFKEVIYSVCAAVFGVMGCGQKDDLSFFVLAGALGPAVFLVVVLVFLGIGISTAWCIKRLRYWYAGY